MLSMTEFVSGGLAGMAQVISAHPLDLVKTRLQLNTNQQAYKGPIDCLVKTVKQEGFFTLYKGMGAPIVGVAFVNAVLFSSFGFFKNIQCSARQSPSQLSIAQIGIAGSFAGIVNSFVAGPIEMVKLRLQAERNTGEASKPTQLVSRIYSKFGVSGLFRGLQATIIKEIPAYFGFFGAYETSCRLLADSPYESPTNLSPPALVLSGAIGGLGYWVSCYPLDVIKTRIQNTDTNQKSANFIQNVKDIYSEMGFRGFYRGFSACLLRAVPSAAATFVVYELSMKHLAP